MTKSDNAGVISVRVCNEVKEKLQIESKRKAITLNTLISQVLTKYVQWDIFAGDIGLVFLTKSFLRSILQQTDDKIIREIAVSTCKRAMRDATIFVKGEMNLDNFIDFFDSWMSASHIPSRHFVNEKHHYVIQHELGRKWSIYVSSLVSALLGEIGHKMIDPKIDENSIAFAIEKMS